MPRLSESQLQRLDEIWVELGASSASMSPPMTDEEVDAAALDSWIAGVISGRGEYTEAAVHDLRDLARQSDPDGEVGRLIERTAQLVSPKG